MHGWEKRMLLKHYLDQGVTKTELSKRFGVSRRTIHAWIAEGDLDRDLSAGGARYGPRPRRPHKLDAYKGIIDARLREFPKLSVRRLFENVNLRTMNHVVPDLEMQVYSSQLFEADTLVGVFNGLYIVTQDHADNPATRQRVEDWLQRERAYGKKPFNLPVKHEGVFRGEFEVFDDQQNLVGTNQVTMRHKPINLLHSEQTIELEGVINRKWTAMRARTANHHQFHGPDLFGNGISYGRYLYGIRHVYGEAFKFWSREAVIDDSFTLVCTWQFLQSQKEKYTTCGVLRWEQGDLVLDAQHVR